MQANPGALVAIDEVLCCRKRRRVNSGQLMHIGNITEMEMLLRPCYIRFDASGIADTASASNLLYLHFVQAQNVGWY